MHELKQDAKCTACNGDIFHRTRKHKLAMHVGVLNTATGVRHASCEEHLKAEIKRQARLNRKKDVA